MAMTVIFRTLCCKALNLLSAWSRIPRAHLRVPSETEFDLGVVLSSSNEHWDGEFWALQDVAEAIRPETPIVLRWRPGVPAP
jgi:hypothetical protein